VRFKIDENLPTDVSELLSAAGFDSQTVFAEGLRGTKDSDLDEVCRREERALVTLDLDFADIREYPPMGSPGRIVLRMVRQDRRTVLSAMQAVVALLQEEDVADRLWIVEEHRIRIRGED